MYSFSIFVFVNDRWLDYEFYVFFQIWPDWWMPSCLSGWLTFLCGFRIQLRLSYVCGSFLYVEVTVWWSLQWRAAVSAGSGGQHPTSSDLPNETAGIPPWVAQRGRGGKVWPCSVWRQRWGQLLFSLSGSCLFNFARFAFVRQVARVHCIIWWRMWTKCLQCWSLMWHTLIDNTALVYIQLGFV